MHCRAVMNPISKYSEDLQRKVLNILHQLFKTAIANGIVAKNPTENLEITPHAKPENQTQFLTTEQQRELLARVTEPRARAFCALMLFCGLRREEALGVLWTDIEGNKLHVRRSLTFPVNQPDENRELKTTKANRAIPIPQRLKDILNETPKTALQIVPNAHGQEMTLSAFQRLWAHVEKSVSFHVYPCTCCGTAMRLPSTAWASASSKRSTLWVTRTCGRPSTSTPILKTATCETLRKS